MQPISPPAVLHPEGALPRIGSFACHGRARIR